jgi:hypothetical protein
MPKITTRAVLVTGAAVVAAVAMAASADTLAAIGGEVGWGERLRWSLPVSVDVLALVAGLVWLAGGVPDAARQLGRWLTLVTVVGSVVLNALGHLVSTGHVTVGPELVIAVSAVPPLAAALAVHLAATVAQRREQVAAMRAEGKSVRQISRTLGLGVGTVHRDIADAVPNGTPRANPVVGSDGKVYAQSPSVPIEPPSDEDLFAGEDWVQPAEPVSADTTDATTDTARTETGTETDTGVPFRPETDTAVGTVDTGGVSDYAEDTTTPAPPTHFVEAGDTAGVPVPGGRLSDAELDAVVAVLVGETDPPRSFRQMEARFRELGYSASAARLRASWERTTAVPVA